jgi:hypothetical protein
MRINPHGLKIPVLFCHPSLSTSPAQKIFHWNPTDPLQVIADRFRRLKGLRFGASEFDLSLLAIFGAGFLLVDALGLCDVFDTQ